MQTQPIIVVEVPQAHFISVSWNPKKPLEHSIRGLCAVPDFGIGVILAQKKQHRKPQQFVVGCVDTLFNGLDGAAEATRLLLKEFKGNTAEVTAHLVINRDFMRVSQVRECYDKVVETLLAEGITPANRSYSLEMCAGIDMATGRLLSADTLASPHCLRLHYGEGAERDIINFIKAAQHRSVARDIWVSGERASPEMHQAPISKITLISRVAEERLRDKVGWDKFRLFIPPILPLREVRRGRGRRQALEVNHNRDVS